MGVKFSLFGDPDVKKEQNNLIVFLAAHQVFGRYLRGILPSQKGSGVELEDYRWIANIRTKRGDLDTLSMSILNEIASHYGSPNAFVPEGRYDAKLQSIARAHNVFNKLKALDRPFSHHTEYKDYMWVAAIVNL